MTTSTDFEIQTLGCKVNTYDTSLLEKHLSDAGFVPASNGARVQIINSCAVTEKSSLETHKLVKKLKAKNPGSIVVITGCVAQVDVDRLKSLSGADLIIGNSHKGDFSQILRDYLEGRLEGRSVERVFHGNIFKKTALDEGGGIESGHTRAFLKIQDGCNSFCSFCIIPFARGKSRSLPVEHLISRVRNFHSQGFQEIVLTGVHCGDYEDQDRDFSSLIEAVLTETKIPRVRLSSLEPIEITERLWRLFKTEPRLCPHIHVSLQSAHSKVLKDMGRKYGRNEIQSFFEKFNQNVPGGFIGMDVIVGFPGETDAEFESTLEFLEGQEGWTRVHVFPYSIRPGTGAAKRVGHLPANVIHARAKGLRALSLSRQRHKALAQMGKTKDVLILEKPSYGTNGLSRDYWPVRVDNIDQTLYRNREIPVEITGALPLKNGEQVLTGRIAKAP